MAHVKRKLIHPSNHSSLMYARVAGLQYINYMDMFRYGRVWVSDSLIWDRM